MSSSDWIDMSVQWEIAPLIVRVLNILMHIVDILYNAIGGRQPIATRRRGNRDVLVVRRSRFRIPSRR